MATRSQQPVASKRRGSADAKHAGGIRSKAPKQRHEDTSPQDSGDPLPRVAPVCVHAHVQLLGKGSVLPAVSPSVLAPSSPQRKVFSHRAHHGSHEANRAQVDGRPRAAQTARHV